MAIVGMSGKNKKESTIEPEVDSVEIRPDTTWYDPSLCNGRHRCPYLEMDDVAQMARCHKPYNEKCLGESMLVQLMLLREHYLRITRQLDEIDVGLTAELDSCVKMQKS